MDLGFQINEYLIATDDAGEIKGKYKWNGEEFIRISQKRIKDLKPKSYKQECLCDMLSNEKLPIRIIAGVPGSGKTKLCLSYGLEFLARGTYSKIFLIRHNVSVGEKNGYLPGDKFEKIRAWLGFFEDNLDNVQWTIEEMITKNMLEVDTVEYMKGRDIKNAWIMVDESEDLTCDQFKMLGERISAGSVICFIGDYEQTTQEKYIKDNGLIRAINNLSGDPNVGIIVFDDKQNDNVRSEASKIFTYKY